MQDEEAEIDEGSLREEIPRGGEAEADEAETGRRWWGEVKSRRGKVDIARVYIGVGGDNDVI